VKRFARRLEAKTEIPFRRMESLPGTRCRSILVRGRGWSSRTAASAVRTSPGGLKPLEEGLHGGRVAPGHGVVPALHRERVPGDRRVTRTVVVDNLKAAVLQADWYDPELNPKLAEFARFYGTVILPCKPGMPRHKGKCEAGVDYAQENAVKGRRFESLGAQNIYLAEWERNVADTRIHGTIHQQVRPFFLTAEQPLLLPLPADSSQVLPRARGG